MSSQFLLRLLLLALLPFSVQALELSWVGCGITRNAFMADLAAAYELETGISINIAGGGATKGIRAIAARQADIGGALPLHAETQSGGSRSQHDTSGLGCTGRCGAYVQSPRFDQPAATA
ncbi:MAG: hypothetical protein KZQ78_08370 [Candidatus Thiodiazotropha sp. (ex Ustalcina ferruginea)]|nr:hypothetical protein [Candidatus Thiodiazotropha sp. (ex Ustalcina ferruginea)]